MSETRLGRRVEAVENRRVEARLAQQFTEALRLLRQHDDAVPARHAAHELPRRGLEPSRIGVVRCERDAVAIALAARCPAFEVGARDALVELADERLLLEVGERRLRPEVAHGDQLVAPLGGQRILLGGGREDRVGLVDDHERVGPEMVEQRRPGGERAVAGGRGQLAAPERRQLVGGEVVEGATARGLQVAGKLAQRLAAREPLPGRADVYGLRLLNRALRVGVEAADRLDLIAEQLDAHGRGLGGREHVDEPAAPRRLARLLDERADLVPRADEAHRKLLEGDPVADGDARGARAEVGGPSSGAGHRGGRGDHERRRAAASGTREAIQHVEAALRDIGRGVLARVGEARAGGEEDGCVARPGAQRVEGRVGVRLARHDEQRRRPQPAPQPHGDGRLRGVDHADRGASAPAEVGGGRRERLDAVEAAEQGGELQGGLLAASGGAQRARRGARRSRGAPRGSPLRSRPLAHPV